ncbi:MAG TPA: small ribosomal subunit Rsm22 family protein [Verrucomicrobiae bacterium]|nr:small ribosomal subunit Rsm22 family protein [Verrucomicrobiae bacterium]
MNWENIDWKALQRLRAAFLDGTAGAGDYWRNERDLESYDQTFGQRISWKWDYVLTELKARGWKPSQGVTVDWGCGSGIAAHAFLTHFGTETVSKSVLWDRSPLAMKFAARKIREAFPDMDIWLDQPPTGEFHTLLISHTLSELSDRAVDELLALATNATSVIWVEPGTHDASRRLIAIRERLRSAFQVVSPCTHQSTCGMLVPRNGRHWCHHFASSPPHVFTDGHWARFAKLAGVDLRSLPVSFLVLDKRPQPTSPDLRVIGSPRVYKAHASVLGCDSSGIREVRLTKRDQPEEFRRLKKGDIAVHMPLRPDV